MFSRSFTKIYQGVTPESVWNVWADVENWPKWDSELEYCDISGPFEDGTSFILKPKGGPKVTIILYDVVQKKSFSDLCRFPGAVMHDLHEIRMSNDSVEITNTIRMKGVLSFLWWFLVGKNVSKSIEKQTDNLVAHARNSHA